MVPTVSAALTFYISVTGSSKKDLSLKEANELTMCYKLLSKHHTNGKNFTRQQRVMDAASF